MQAEVSFGQGNQLLAPSTYTIHANTEHSEALKSNQALLDELSDALKHAAAQSGVALASDPVLHIAPDEQLEAGEFRVRCAGMGESLARTQSLRTNGAPGQHQVPNGAFFIVSGTDIFQLNLPIINIGRKNDNHLVIENPQVSRRHAQLRAIGSSYHFFDLGSTGGSRINGTPVKNAALLTGDVITLAGIVPLIYSQDESKAVSATQEYRPGENGNHPAS
jgi:hypothetical protein